MRHEGPEGRTVLELVRSGLGPALLPRSAAEGAAGVVAVPFTEPRLVHRTEVLHRDGAGGAAAVLTGLLTGARGRSPGARSPVRLSAFCPARVTAAQSRGRR
ncbi:hypothetical protein [Actinacidiphila sp. bgisy160]|uniref:hypothetical protein n=1 Tax=Actinacidiphila sp. bgisy160 TaxID=3413796 RepID=UPI003D75D97E